MALGSWCSKIQRNTFEKFQTNVSLKNYDLVSQDNPHTLLCVVWCTNYFLPAVQSIRTTLFLNRTTFLGCSYSSVGIKHATCTEAISPTPVADLLRVITSLATFFPAVSSAVTVKVKAKAKKKPKIDELLSFYETESTHCAKYESVKTPQSCKVVLCS